MKIINSSKNTTLSSHAHPAQSLVEKILGLITSPEGKTMIFKTRYGIHTFFMKYPIDILILDNKNRAVMLRERLLPNNIFLWNPIFSTVIELPAGTIQNSKTKKGDIIDII